MKKVFALLLVSVFAFGMVGCSEDEETCTTEAATACSDAYTACTTDAGTDMTVFDACTTTFCTCLTDIGCEVTAVCTPSDSGV